MKKLIPLFALGLTARAGDTSGLIGKAMSDSTINACVQAAKQPGYEIKASVSDTSATTGAYCLIPETTYRVDFFKDMRCNENGGSPCPKPAAQLVASAEFGCGGALVVARCY